MPVPDGASADSAASKWPAKASISLRAPRSPSACAARRRGQGKATSGYLGMDQILPPELNAFEFEALRQIAAHPATSHIPSRIQTRLKDIGYVTEVMGGLVLTDDGLRRIAIDR